MRIEELEAELLVRRDAANRLNRETSPLAWAQAQHDLGVVLTQLGDCRWNVPMLEAAVAAFRAALLERRREVARLDWAETQFWLGNALWEIGERGTGAERHREAVEALRAAVAERDLSMDRRAWVRDWWRLGDVLRDFAEQAGEPERLAEAVVAYRAAQEGQMGDGTSEGWPYLARELALAEYRAAWSGDRAGLRRALDVADTAIGRLSAQGEDASYLLRKLKRVRDIVTERLEELG